jgi:hypothetical protein
VSISEAPWSLDSAAVVMPDEAQLAHRQLVDTPLERSLICFRGEHVRATFETPKSFSRGLTGLAIM